MIVLDASVLIAHLDADDAHHPQAESLLLDVVGEPLVTSVLTLAEVLVAPVRAGRPDRALAALDRLSVGVIGIAEDAASRLAGLRAGTGLKLPDCCVIDLAQDRRVPLATFDDRLAEAARRLDVGVVP